MTVPTMRARKFIALSVALAATFAAVMVMTRTNKASAAIGDLTCIGGAGSVVFTPGVLLTTRTSQANFTGSLGTCISLSHPAITGGTYVVGTTSRGNCSTGGSGSGSGTVTFNSSGHPTSTFTLSFSVGLVAGIPTMSGQAHITGGQFTGDMALSLPLTAAFNPAACATPSGLTSATFAGATTVAS
jgi:hypothetical protein